MKKALLTAGFFALASLAHSQESPNWQPAIVGTGLILAPMALQSPDLSWGHGMELEGWSYAATDVFGRFLPKGFWFLSPIVIGAVDGLYRKGEMNDKASTALATRKLGCDLLGVVGRVAVEIKF